MNAPIEAVLRHVGKWMLLADQDLQLSQHGLFLGENTPFHLIAYHAQQCAEKYLKSYLVFKGVDFPYTHNILRLIELLPDEADWIEQISEADLLSSYAVSARYPGEDEPVTEYQANEAIQIAKQVRIVLRRVLISEIRCEGMENKAKQFWPIPDHEWETVS